MKATKDYGSVKGAFRKIIHIDMDAYFTSIEQRENPELKGRPVVVGGKGKRSVVAAASYEARKYGIHSAMPMSNACRKCKELIIITPNFGLYREVSIQIRQIFNRFTDLVEPLSIDEAFLDITENKLVEHSATRLARKVKRQILNETDLTCSAGISINKFLAKMASGVSKPDGLTVISPDQIDAFVAGLPVERFYGIGRVTSTKMKEEGIHTGADLQKLTESELVRRFGKNGKYFYQISRGIDDRPVEPQRIRKSISVERTYEEDITNPDEINRALKDLSSMLGRSMRSHDTGGKTITIKVRYPDFTTVNRSVTLADFVRDESIIYAKAIELMDTLPDRKNEFRLLGIGISKLDSGYEFRQLRMDFDEKHET